MQREQIYQKGWRLVGFTIIIIIIVVVVVVVVVIVLLIVILNQSVNQSTN